MQMLRCLKTVDVWSICHRQGEETVTEREEKWAPHHCKRDGGQESNGKEGKRAAGQGSQATCKYQILYCVRLNIHIRAHKCFQNIVFSGSLLLALLILSLYVCIYTYKATHHTRTDTHTFSIYVCLSFLCVCDRERGGFPLSLDVCTLCRWVVENGGGEFECILELLAS